MEREQDDTPGTDHALLWISRWISRLDPLADRHPPAGPAVSRKLDTIAVLTGPVVTGTPGPSPSSP
jgi:hypothetical protein